MKRLRSYVKDETVDIGFELMNQIGAGAFGTVYATTNPDRVVKVLAKNRFLRHEIDILERLKGKKGIVDMLMAAEEIHSEATWIVFERADCSLDKIIWPDGTYETDRDAPMHVSAKRVVKYMSQAIRALREVHAQGVVHTDIKPSNFLVTKQDDLLLCDFGSALYCRGKYLDLADTDYGCLTTLWYRAPELIYGRERVTKKLDVWSLGMTFLALITGHVTYSPQDVVELAIVYQVVFGTPKEYKFSEVFDSCEDPPCIPERFPALRRLNEFKPLLKMMMRPDPENRASALSCSKEMERVLKEDA